MIAYKQRVIDMDKLTMAHQMALAMQSSDGEFMNIYGKDTEHRNEDMDGYYKMLEEQAKEFSKTVDDFIGELDVLMECCNDH